MVDCSGSHDTESEQITPSELSTSIVQDLSKQHLDGAVHNVEDMIGKRDNAADAVSQVKTPDLGHPGNPSVSDPNIGMEAATQVPEPPASPSNDQLCLGMFEEDPRKYCPGGLHPVHLGDIYNTRYQVLYKLGYGCFSTVWLVHDQQTGTNLCMKINTATLSTTTHELEVLRALSTIDPVHLGHKHVLQLLDSFFHDGSNGRHLCIITEILGPKAFDHEQRMYEGMECGYAKEISAQLLIAVDTIREAGVVHGDIYPNNFVLRFTADLKNMSVQELGELLGEPEVVETIRVDKSALGPGEPRHAVHSVDLLSVLPAGCLLWEGVLTDFGTCK